MQEILFKIFAPSFDQLSTVINTAINRVVVIRNNYIFLFLRIVLVFINSFILFLLFPFLSE